MIFQNDICNSIKVIYFKDQYCTIPAKISLNTIIIKNKKNSGTLKMMMLNEIQVFPIDFEC